MGGVDVARRTVPVTKQVCQEVTTWEVVDEEVEDYPEGSVLQPSNYDLTDLYSMGRDYKSMDLPDGVVLMVPPGDHWQYELPPSEVPIPASWLMFGAVIVFFLMWRKPWNS